MRPARSRGAGRLLALEPRCEHGRQHRYRPSEAHEGDFTIRLTDDLTVRYDRDDDQLLFPAIEAPLYNAVRIETDADHTGDISLYASADVTSNGRRISVGHYGKSGALRMEISGGAFSITSDWPPAFAIHSYRGDGFDANDETSGNHDLIVRNVVVDLHEAASAGVLGVQTGEGYLNVAVQDSAINIAIAGAGIALSSRNPPPSGGGGCQWLQLSLSASSQNCRTKRSSARLRS